MPRDIVEIPDGFDKNADGTPVDSDTAPPPSSTGRTVRKNSVANGYGDTAAGDNDFNYGSKTRIGGMRPTPLPARSQLHS